MKLRPLIEQLKGRKSLVGAEIGVWGAKNSLEILKGLDIKKLYLIDPYAKYDDGERTFHDDPEKVKKVKAKAKRRIQDYKDKVIWKYKPSMEAVKEIEEGELDFVYIDGNHKYSFVLEDITEWTKKVKKGGFVTGHDYDIPDVARALKDYCEKHGYWERLHLGLKVRKIEYTGQTMSVGPIDWWFWKEGD